MILVPTPHIAAAAERGNDLIIVMPGSPEQLDPCQSPRSVVGRILNQNVVETLTDVTYEPFKIEPKLATSWVQISPKIWEFSLRRGVRFHDGSIFDADAVVKSINRTLSDKLNCITKSKYFLGLKIEAQALDRYTVRIGADQPIPILPTLMTKLAIYAPSTPVDHYTNNPIGTGPFRFIEFQNDAFVRIKRDDAYWGNLPKVTAATYIWGQTSALAADLIETGIADIAFSISPEHANAPALDKAYPNSETTLFRLNLAAEPLNDKRVRQALNFAIDRESLRTEMLHPASQIANQRVGPHVLGFNPDLKPYPFDPTRAGALLDEARADGVAVDSVITIVAQSDFFPSSISLTYSVSHMLQSVGLNIKVRFVTLEKWLDFAFKPYDPNAPPTLLMSMHDNNSGDAAFTVFFKYHSQGQQSDINDPNLDAMIERASKSQSANRETIYRKIFERVHREIIPEIPLFHMVNIMRVNERLVFTPNIANASELNLSDISFNQDNTGPE